MNFREKLRDIIYSPLVLFPENIPYRDKVAHATIGMLLYLIFWYILTPQWSLFIIFGIAALKEFLDKYVINGTPEFYDWLATVTIPSIITLFILMFTPF